MTADLKDDRGLNFETLQALRHLESKLIPIPSMIRCLISTLSSIQAMNKKLSNPGTTAETAYHLASCSSRLKSYIATAEVLQKRIENLTKFVSRQLLRRNK
jgi:hypothetical protein